MKATFRTKQPLESLEFGTLLHDLLPMGVYKSPNLSLVNVPTDATKKSLEMNEGVFLFYNKLDNVEEDDQSYAIRVELEKSDGSIGCPNIPTTGIYYVFASYKWSSTSDNMISLEYNTEMNKSDNSIRICRIINGEIDSSVMQMAGFGYNSPNSVVDYVQYKKASLESGSEIVKIKLNNKFITNNGLLNPIYSNNGEVWNNNYSQFSFTTYNPTGISTPLSSSGSFYIFLDSEGKLQLASSSISRLGKLVVAEKLGTENAQVSTDFIPTYLPMRAEINGDTIQIPYNKDATGLKKEVFEASQGADSQVVLTRLFNSSLDKLNELYASITAIQQRVSNLETSSSLVNGAFEVTNTEIRAKKKLVTKEGMELPNGKTANLNGITNINGGINFGSQSTFGTAESPINTLYVKNSLYTENLVIEE